MAGGGSGCGGGAGLGFGEAGGVCGVGCRTGGCPVALRLTQADALMLDAMLFGDRTGLTHTLRTSFERTGSFHLFVVSGLHIALLAGALVLAACGGSARRSGWRRC